MRHIRQTSTLMSCYRIRRPPSATSEKFLNDINATDIAEFENLLPTLTLANSPENWNCQNYVMDVIEALEEKGVIDKDDVANTKAKKQVKEHFGPLPQRIEGP